MLLVSEAVFKAVLYVPFQPVTLVLYTRLESLSYDDDDDWEENIKQQEVWISKITTLHFFHAFLYISCPSLHNHNVKLPNFTFCGRRERNTTTFSFFS